MCLKKNESLQRIAKGALFFRLRQIRKNVLQFVFLLRRKKGATNFSPAAKKCCAPKIACCLVAAVAQNSFFDPNAAPAQQRNG